MLKLRAISLLSILTLFVLNACSDLSSVSLSPTSAVIPTEVLQNIEESSVSNLKTPQFEQELNQSILSLFTDLRYSQETVESLNFNYVILEDDFSKSGFTLDPATGYLTGQVLPDSQNTDDALTIEACLGTSSTYNIQITDPDSGTSVVKSFTIEKPCDDCGDLAPFAQYTSI